MKKKDLSEYKRKYDISRHHAWAGGILLSVLLAIRLLIPLPDEIILPLAIILIVYILIALFFTYKYSSGLSSTQQIAPLPESIEKEKIQADLEKERLKVEKKKAKAEAKAQKKKVKR